MRQKKALAAMLVCAPCCSGSGQGSRSTVICPSGFCIASTIEVPNNEFVLSITEIADYFYPLPIGDISLTYQTNIVIGRNACDVGSESRASGWYSQSFVLETIVEGCDNSMRYHYDPCTGILSIVYESCGDGCPGEGSVVFDTLATLDIVDCNPYYAELDDSPSFVGSVSV